MMTATSLFPKHWHFINFGNGVHATNPTLAKCFSDELELGDRVAYCFDGEALWGAKGIIMFMAAPGAPWEG